jgi:hypothetical protein
MATALLEPTFAAKPPRRGIEYLGVDGTQNDPNCFLESGNVLTIPRGGVFLDGRFLLLQEKMYI